MRKTKSVTITAEGRDKGRIYFLTEMPAAQAEKWGMRAIFLAARSGADLPDAASTGGIAAVAQLGVQALLGGVQFGELEPLLDQLMACVQFCPDPSRPEAPRLGPLLPGEIDETSTYALLRMEVFNLHAGFSIGELLSTLFGKTKS